MWELFAKSKKLQPVEQRACLITWRYEHSPAVMACAREADTREFAAWVRTLGESEAITRRQLVSLYAEFCELRELRPMAWHRFDCSLKGAGFQRFRLSAAGRPWLYRVARPGSALVYKMPPCVARQRQLGQQHDGKRHPRTYKYRRPTRSSSRLTRRTRPC